MKKHKLIKQIGVISVSLIVMFNCANSYAQENQKEKKERILKIRRLISKTLSSIDKAYRNNEIGRDEKLIYKTKTFMEPELVPERFRAAKYEKERPERKYHQDLLKKVLEEIREEWLKTNRETHSKIWSSEIFSHLKKYIKEEAKKRQDRLGYRFLYISPKEAYILKEINLDQLMLYRYGPPKERPERFIPPERTIFPDPPPRDCIQRLETEWILPLAKYSKYLKPETKEKIKLYHWREEAQIRNRKLKVIIDSPKEGVNAPSRYGGSFYVDSVYEDGEWKDLNPKGGAETYTGEVKIKGKITSPEMYDITSAWARVGGERKEIKLGSRKYERPESFDEKALKEWRKGFEKFSEERMRVKIELDEFMLDYGGGPRKLVRPFEVMIKLPRFNENVISVGAKNSGGQSAGAKILVTYYDGTDKEPPKVEIKDPKNDTTLGELGVYKRKGEVMLPVLCDATDNKKILRIEIYLNGKLEVVTSTTDNTHIGYDENGKSIWANYYRGDVPVKTGKNKIKVIAYDIGNNKESDKIKVVYRPEKK